jgi:hypothetical protein
MKLDEVKTCQFGLAQQNGFGTADCCSLFLIGSS